MQLSFVTSELIPHMSYQALVQLFLVFSNPFLLGSIAVIGLIIDRRNYAPATLLLLFSMILNPFLKSLFAIPLPAEVTPSGYSFPSGHTTAAVIFYGWLFWNYRSNLTKFCTLFLMIGVSWSLIAVGYHNIFDIIASWLVASLAILIYSYLLRSQKTVVTKVAKGRSQYERLLRGETFPSCLLLLISLALLGCMGWFYAIKLESYVAIISIPLLIAFNYFRATKRELPRGVHEPRDDRRGEIDEVRSERNERGDRGDRRDDRRGGRRDDRRGDRRDDRRPQ